MSDVTTILMKNGVPGAPTHGNDLPGPMDEVARLQTRVTYLETQIKEARAFPKMLRGVLIRLLYDAKHVDDLPADADIDSMYDRLVELVKADDDEDLWLPERDFYVRADYTVTVRGSIRARSQADAEAKFEADGPAIKAEVEHPGDLDDAYIDDITFHVVDIS